MESNARISVIIRALDEAASIGRCIQLVRSQKTGLDKVEVIVVDSGSTDATMQIARRFGARVVSVERSSFTFGGALNAGAAVAEGEVLVALSAHAFPLDQGWLARLAGALDDAQVACASGDRYQPDGMPLEGRVLYDEALAARWPQWGYSNAAGAFRASLWRERPFREDLPACEDREWCRWWIGQGFVCVLDPLLLVEHDHTHDPAVSIYLRARREATGYAMFLPPAPRPGLGGLAREWWSDTRFYDSRLRARLSHRRAARLLGSYAGARGRTERAGSAAGSG
jgi:glycosyltransferase involved in cell wall biosynthesis